jgi:RHS repeat-associated protein
VTPPSGAGQAYTSNAYGQTVTAPGGLSYAYDGLGRLVTRSTSAASASLAWLGAGDTLTSDGTDTYSYDPSGAVSAVRDASGSAFSTLADRHGDVTGTFSPTSAAEGLAGSASYGPYGAGSVAGFRVSLGYQGDWTDSSTGLADMNARWYDPSTGSFTSNDTITGSPLSTTIDGNPYGYADGNPVTYTDPTGHLCGVFAFVCDPVVDVGTWAWDAGGSLVDYATPISEDIGAFADPFAPVFAFFYALWPSDLGGEQANGVCAGGCGGAPGGPGPGGGQSGPGLRGPGLRHIRLIRGSGWPLRLRSCVSPAAPAPAAAGLLRRPAPGVHPVQGAVRAAQRPVDHHGHPRHHQRERPVPPRRPHHRDRPGEHEHDHRHHPQPRHQRQPRHPRQRERPARRQRPHRTIPSHQPRHFGERGGTGGNLPPAGPSACEPEGPGDSGSISAGSVRFTQDSISQDFRGGGSVMKLAQDIVGGVVAPGDLPQIRIFERNGLLYSLDNRRLFAGKMADVDLPYRMATQAELNRELRFKFTTTSEGTSIVVRGVGEFTWPCP